MRLGDCGGNKTSLPHHIRQFTFATGNLIGITFMLELYPVSCSTSVSSWDNFSLKI